MFVTAERRDVGLGDDRNAPEATDLATWSRAHPVTSPVTSPWPDDIFSAAADADEPFTLHRRAGGAVVLDQRRWHDAPGPADLAVLARTRGAVLDIGCGPGRLVHALTQAGLVALGIDASAAAVAATRRRGAPAVHASVFGPVPSAGRWETALLLDGNIGIGGNVSALLHHVRSLISPRGLILVEVESAWATTEDIEVRVERRGGASRWFRWSRVAAKDLPALARSASLVVDDLWQHSGRWFAQLVPADAEDGEIAC